MGPIGPIFFPLALKKFSHLQAVEINSVKFSVFAQPNYSSKL
jgi:hypothetical protein